MSLPASERPFGSLSGRFGTILADPPWPESGGGKIKRGADRHYRLMTVGEIASLPVAGLALPDSHLYLWTTNNCLRRAFEVVDAWGFRYITTITWRKLGRRGLGQYFRGTTEHVLFCVRGCPPYRALPDGRRAQGVTDVGDEGAYFDEARPGPHSRKPERIHEFAEVVSPGPYLELFARTARPGWAAWGDEAPTTTPEDFLK